MPPKQDPKGGGDYAGKFSKANKPHRNPRSHSRPRVVAAEKEYSFDYDFGLSQKLNEVKVGAPEKKTNDRGREDAPVRNEAMSTTTVEKILECPICFQIPKVPIYSCQTGHTVCGECQKRVPHCPLCRKGFTNVRNFVAEQLAAACTRKCRYSDMGCEATLAMDEEDAHMDLCNFRPVGCEVYPCSSDHIEYSDYLDHLKQIHRAMMGQGGQSKVRRDVYVRKPERVMEKGHRVPYIISCFGQRFLQYSQAIGDKKMWFWVSLLGTPEEASRYRVTLALVTRDKDLRATWTGPVHSVRHSGDDIYFNGLCMVTTEECLKAFFAVHPDGFPMYSMEIEIQKVR